MLQFYGFEMQLAEQAHQFDVTRGPNFPQASRNWVKRFDHNHLRITRIIRCLRVLGMEAHAGAFFRALVDVYDSGRSGISAKSMMFVRHLFEFLPSSSLPPQISSYMW